MRTRILERNPAFRPITNFVQCILELSALLGQLVLNSDRCFRNNRANDKVFSFEGAEPFGEHPVCNIRDGSLDQRIASPALKEGAQNSPCPTATDELNSAVEPRTDVRNLSFGRVGHGIEVIIPAP